MMRRGFQFALLVALAAPAAILAQTRGTAPPASIYSLGGSSLGPPPASIYSLPSRPAFCCGGNVSLGRGSAVGGQVRNFSVPRQGRGHARRNGTGGAVYVPYAVYPYSDYADDGQPLADQEIEGGGTFQGRSREMEADRQAPTIFENRPGSPYRSSPDIAERMRADDSRYGTHYMDSRDRDSRENSERTKVDSSQSDNSAGSVIETAPTVLVFRDGRKQEITNYAIMGKTLFVLSGERAKIPMSELDVDATIAANDKRGTDFRVPKN